MNHRIVILSLAAAAGPAFFGCAGHLTPDVADASDDASTTPDVSVDAARPDSADAAHSDADAGREIDADAAAADTGVDAWTDASPPEDAPVDAEREASSNAVEITLFPVRSGALPTQITSGPDGNLWFTENYEFPASDVNPRIAKMTTTGILTEYEIDLPDGGGGPVQLGGITSGPDGNLWFTAIDVPDGTAGWLGRITPAGEYVLFRVPGLPYAITSGADGALWMTDGTGYIRRSTVTGSLSAFPIPSAVASDSWYQAITLGPDGNVWFAEYNGPMGETEAVGRIGQITPAGEIAEYELPTTTAPSGEILVPDAIAIVTGPDGNLWFTESLSSDVGRITPAGVFTPFQIPAFFFTIDDDLTDEDSPGIVTGPDGNLWFTACAPNSIGRLTPEGVFTDFPLPPNEDAASPFTPYAITLGSDGNLWFIAYDGDTGKIGRLTP